MSSFFRTCFAPSRLTGGICVVDLVRSWARHHTPADVARAAGQVDTMLSAGVSDDALRVWVLGAAGCGYDPGMQGMAMGQWLGLVRDLLLGQSDWALPPGAWEALRPWPQPQLGSLEVLRHLLTGYFHASWKATAPTFEAVVEHFVATEGPARAAALVDDIDELLALAPGEERLRIIVLGRFGSSYDPRPDLPGGQRMAQWLRSVRGVALSCALAG
ncbi:MAG TPA: contact-dependent growth inhibition system immunity protein [Acidimicrobiales bacterium]|nr:contact-dependent growth inhibition system immunity protein [Acidimicrobiales bacterium]